MTARSYARDRTPDASTVVGFDGTVLARITWQAESEEHARVVVEGDVDRDTAPLLRSVLLDALAHRAVVRCDLKRTAFFGAAGVDALVQVHVRAAESGRTVLLTGVGEAVAYVLGRTGVLGVLTVER